MTDCGLVRDELKALLSLTDDEADGYDALINYAVSCIGALIKNSEDENDIRIVHLCAVKAYYQLSLVQDDGISSFSAGEVSYSRDTSAHGRAKALLDDAVSACADLISGGFAFKAV